MKNQHIRPPRDVSGKVRTACWYALASLIVAAAVGLGAAVAHADSKVFPGTVCQVWGGHSSDAQYISYSQFGAVVNTHPSKRLGVVCPVMRDRPDRRMDVSVYWSDGYGPAHGARSHLSCRLRSNNIWGQSSMASSAHDSENWPDSHVDTDPYGSATHERGRFRWNNLLGQQTGDPMNYGTSSYTLFCLLPPVHAGHHSSVGSFAVNED